VCNARGHVLGVNRDKGYLQARKGVEFSVEGAGGGEAGGGIHSVLLGWTRDPQERTCSTNCLVVK